MSMWIDKKYTDWYTEYMKDWDIKYLKMKQYLRNYSLCICKSVRKCPCCLLWDVDDIRNKVFMKKSIFKRSW